MLVLLPPSEGKFAPTRGRRLDLSSLSFPALYGARATVLHSLVELCRGDSEKATDVLGLPLGLAGEVRRNAALLEAPTAAAARIYTGVLYDALGLDSLSPAAKRRASSRLLVTSSLFGLVRPGDRIPAYRLSGDVTLPDLGTVASVWRQPIAAVLGRVTTTQLVVDMRSGMYASVWRPTKEQARRVVSVRVLHEVAGARLVVSHFNKATKGRIVRGLLEDGANPKTPAALVRKLTDLGWIVEPTPGMPGSVDVIVTEV